MRIVCSGYRGHRKNIRRAVYKGQYHGCMYYIIILLLFDFLRHVPVPACVCYIYNIVIGTCIMFVSRTNVLYYLYIALYFIVRGSTAVITDFTGTRKSRRFTWTVTSSSTLPCRRRRRPKTGLRRLSRRRR